MNLLKGIDSIIDKVNTGQIPDEASFKVELYKLVQKAVEEELKKETDSKPKEEKTLELSEEEKREALEFLKTKNLVREFLKDTSKVYVGREKERLLTFLVGLMSYTNEGGSLVITGESSTGKSKLLDTVLACFPEDKKSVFTYTSERYLLYSRESISNKIVAFYELKGSEVSQYSIRSGLTETKLRLGTVDKSGKGQLRAKEIEKDTTGMVFMATTVEDRINPELETRVFKIELKPQSPEEMKAIYRLQGGKVDLSFMEKWRKALSLLETREVEIPYLDKLVENFPTEKERYKRDFQKVIQLIKASCILNQYQRQLNDRGELIATREDYETVYSLRDLITESISPVSEKVREFLKTVKELEDKTGTPPSRAEVMEAMGKSEPTIKLYAREAQRKGLIEVFHEKKRVYYHCLEIPKVQSVLPEPDVIFGIIRLSDSSKTATEEEENQIIGELSDIIRLSDSLTDNQIKTDNQIIPDKNGIIRFSETPEATLDETDNRIMKDSSKSLSQPSNGGNGKGGKPTSFLQFKALVPSPLREKTDPQELYYWFEEFKDFPEVVVQEGFKRNPNSFELCYAFCKWYTKEFLQ